MDNKIVEVDLDFFINAVENNNFYNDGKWEDWTDEDDIIEVYTSTEETDYIFIEEISYIKNELNKIINKGE